ncbi:MAG: hypothetical protein J6R32_06885 [Bacteroidales bacterium]|nr:hypothetical protein [Bacteroidales bacterium]
MAKVAFSKLGIKKVNNEVKNIQFNEVEIEVKQYLPIQDKLTIIGNAINNAADGNRFVNPAKLDMYTTLEVLYAYADISFTEKQKEDSAKLYDLVISSGLVDEIYRAIPEQELNTIYTNVMRVAESMYAQMNSVYGIMENIAQDYANTSMEATDIQQKLADPNNLTLLKDVMSKLG